MNLICRTLSNYCVGSWPLTNSSPVETGPQWLLLNASRGPFLAFLRFCNLFSSRLPSFSCLGFFMSLSASSAFRALTVARLLHFCLGTISDSSNLRTWSTTSLSLILWVLQPMIASDSPLATRPKQRLRPPIWHLHPTKISRLSPPRAVSPFRTH